jgi:hypothetical protein
VAEQEPRILRYERALRRIASGDHDADACARIARDELEASAHPRRPRSYDHDLAAEARAIGADPADRAEMRAIREQLSELGRSSEEP